MSPSPTALLLGAALGVAAAAAGCRLDSRTDYLGDKVPKRRFSLLPNSEMA